MFFYNKLINYLTLKAVLSIIKTILTNKLNFLLNTLNNYPLLS